MIAYINISEVRFLTGSSAQIIRYISTIHYIYNITMSESHHHHPCIYNYNIYFKVYEREPTLYTLALAMILSKKNCL